MRSGWHSTADDVVERRPENSAAMATGVIDPLTPLRANYNEAGSSLTRVVFDAVARGALNDS